MEDRKRPYYRMHALPSTPMTRIIPDDELPYFDNLLSGVSSDQTSDIMTI
jgi:hypothetical protein